MAGFAKLIWVDLECADPPGLAEFHQGFQPGGDRWTVLTDPAGHPFCLCPAAEVGR